jgi:hypothetical protein
VDAKGAKALVERLAREGLYSAPAGEPEPEPATDAHEPGSDGEEFGVDGAERAA